MKKKSSIILHAILMVLFCSGTVTAQEDSTRSQSISTYFTPDNLLKFSDFLFQQADYLRAASEYHRYLYLLNENQNYRIFYKIGQCYYNVSQHHKASEFFNKAAMSPDNDALRVNAGD